MQQPPNRVQVTINTCYIPFDYFHSVISTWFMSRVCYQSKLKETKSETPPWTPQLSPPSAGKESLSANTSGASTSRKTLWLLVDWKSVIFKCVWLYLLRWVTFFLFFFKLISVFSGICSHSFQLQFLPRCSTCWDLDIFSIWIVRGFLFWFLF